SQRVLLAPFARAVIWLSLLLVQPLFGMSMICLWRTSTTLAGRVPAWYRERHAALAAWLAQLQQVRRRAPNACTPCMVHHSLRCMRALGLGVCVCVRAASAHVHACGTRACAALQLPRHAQRQVMARVKGGQHACEPGLSDTDGPHDVRWCAKCDALKPPRSHHCSLCGECVLKMGASYSHGPLSAVSWRAARMSMHCMICVWRCMADVPRCVQIITVRGWATASAS
ncbi:hypothetical protein EON67_05770, partial [archaeon]